MCLTGVPHPRGSHDVHTRQKAQGVHASGPAAVVASHVPFCGGPHASGKGGKGSPPWPPWRDGPLGGQGLGGLPDTRQMARSPDSLLATHHSLSTRLAVSRPRGLSAFQTGNLKSTFWHVENPHVSGPTAFEATFGSAQPRRAEPAVPNRTYCVWILRSLTPQQRKL